MTEKVYLDDLEPGQVRDLGRHIVTREEIVDFAMRWDPQPFHLDDVAAERSMYGGLIASGWHTVCIFMRLFADGFLNHAVAMGAHGIEELRWRKPVRPGDTLHARAEVLAVQPSHSRPDRGVARIRSVVANQGGDEVLSFVAAVIFGRRSATSARASPPENLKTGDGTETPRS